MKAAKLPVLSAFRDKYLAAFLGLALIIAGSSANAQYTLAGYINTTDPGGSSQACAVTTGVTTPIYTVGGTLNVGQVVYATSTGTLIANDFGFHPFSATSGGTVTFAIQIWGDGVIQTKNDCGGGGGGGAGPCNGTDTYVPAALKVPVHPHHITDWGGWWSGGGNGSNISPARLFDSCTADEFAKGPLRPHTYDSAYGFFFDIDIDSVNLNAIRFYDERGNDDSVYIGRYLYYGNYDTLIRYKSNGAAGWKEFTFTGKPTGRLWVSFKRTIDANFMANLTELKIYGDPYAGSFAEPYRYTGTYRNGTLGSKAGVKNVLENAVAQVEPIANYTSVYRNNNWFDSDNVTYPNNRLDRTPASNLNLFSYPTALAAAGIEMWFSTRGANAYATAQGLDGDYGWAINEINSDRYSFGSYTRAANMDFMIAAVLGPTAVPTSKIRYNPADGAIVTGTNKHTRYQKLNEPDGYFRPSRHNMRELGVQMNMYYDGYEGRYGDTVGMKWAFNTVKMIGPAFAYPDTNSIRSLLRITRDMRTDRADVYAEFDFHDYFTQDTNEVVPTFEQLQASCGDWPESHRKRIYHRLNGLAEVIYRHNPNIRIIHGEWGWDRNRQCLIQGGTVPYTQSPFNVPASVAGYTDSTICQAILSERQMNIEWASRIDESHIYWMQDIGVDNSPITFGSMGLFNAANQAYPAHKVLAQMLDKFPGYNLKEVVATYDDSLYHFIFQKQAQPDSVVSAVWMGNVINLQLSNYNVYMGGTVVGTPDKMQTDFTDYTPIVSSVSASGTGIPNQLITERVTYYRAQITSSGVSNDPIRVPKGKLKFIGN